MDWESLTLEEDEVTEIPCECCRGVTIEAMGHILRDGAYIAWYTARWGANHPDVPAIITVYCGDWSEGAPVTNRWGTRTEVRTGPESGCMLLDWSVADKARIDSFTPLGREDVLGSPYAPEFWACIDAVLMKDQRLEHLTS
ncbi:hypothetical protein [Arenibacterium sp. LLYu02]|uniref:hypothetical protein n=1 Tax=Arenibacterium sp. LLYu02 TaxID=3404132 RepID=UPI003B20E2A5